MDGVFFREKFLLHAKIGIFSDTWIITQGVESTKKFSDNTGHDILELYNILENFWFSTSEAVLDI